MNPQLIAKCHFIGTPPAGLGRNPGPLTGLYMVRCNAMERHSDHNDWFMFDLEVINGQADQIGTKFRVRGAEEPKANMKEGQIQAREAGMKKAKISFASYVPNWTPDTTAGLRDAKGDFDVDLNPLVGAVSGLWWERGNPEAPDKHTQGFGRHRWIDLTEYPKVASGEISIALVNTPLKAGVPGGAGAASYGAGQYTGPTPSGSGPAPSTGVDWSAQSPGGAGAGAAAGAGNTGGGPVQPAGDASAAML